MPASRRLDHAVSRTGLRPPRRRREFFRRVRPLSSTGLDSPAVQRTLPPRPATAIPTSDAHRPLPLVGTPARLNMRSAAGQDARPAVATVRRSAVRRRPGSRQAPFCGMVRLVADKDVGDEDARLVHLPHHPCPVRTAAQSCHVLPDARLSLRETHRFDEERVTPLVSIAPPISDDLAPRGILAADRQ